jgi:cytochrome c biogenesis protein CcmG/thiol:disulfide interchange protein DsbE
MRKLLVAAAVAVGLIAAGGTYALLASRGDADAVAGPVAMNSPLPALRGDAVSGGTVDLADLRGDVTVLNVWATWCGPCRREQPGLVRAAKRYEDRGVRFVGLNYQDNRAAAQAWVEEFNVPYESLFDENGSFAGDLGFPYLPDTYIVDAGGTIRWAIYGETSEAEVSGLIDEVLAAPASPTGA